VEALEARLKQNSTTSHKDKEMLKAARAFQVQELNYRRTHRWQIFAWAAGLLVGGTSITFALKPAATSRAPLQEQLSKLLQLPLSFQQMSFIVTILVLTIISIFWMHHHYKKEKETKNIINKLDCDKCFNFYQNIALNHTQLTGTYWGVVFTSQLALLFLALFATLVVLFS
jgi:hypothetical protein